MTKHEVKLGFSRRGSQKHPCEAAKFGVGLFSVPGVYIPLAVRALRVIGRPEDIASIFFYQAWPMCNDFGAELSSTSILKNRHSMIRRQTYVGTLR